MKMRRIKAGVHITKGYEYNGYELRNHGYYPPERCVWWEAINIKTGEADHHAHTLRDLKAQIDKETP